MKSGGERKRGPICPKQSEQIKTSKGQDSEEGTLGPLLSSLFIELSFSFVNLFSISDGIFVEYI